MNYCKSYTLGLMHYYDNDWPLHHKLMLKYNKHANSVNCSQSIVLVDIIHFIKT